MSSPRLRVNQGATYLLRRIGECLGGTKIFVLFAIRQDRLSNVGQRIERMKIGSSFLPSRQSIKESYDVQRGNHGISYVKLTPTAMICFQQLKELSGKARGISLPDAIVVDGSPVTDAKLILNQCAAHFFPTESPSLSTHLAVES
jgi:hypothetical protein